MYPNHPISRNKYVLSHRTLVNAIDVMSFATTIAEHGG